MAEEIFDKIRKDRRVASLIPLREVERGVRKDYEDYPDKAVAYREDEHELDEN